MSAVASSGLRRLHLRYELPFVAALAAIAVLDVLLINSTTWKLALVCSALPAGLVLFGRTKSVYLGVLMPVLVVTLVYGKVFAQIRVGPAYALDAALLVVALLTIPAILRALGTVPAVSAVLALFVVDGLLHVIEAGATRVVLRQSVIVMYAAWAFLGIAVARSGVLRRILPWFYLGSVGAVVILLRGDRHDVSHDLYVCFGVLLVLFAPQVIRYRRLAYAILVVQLGVLGIGLVRSIWLALPAAIVCTALITGMSPRFKRQIVRVIAITAVLFMVVMLTTPSVVSKLGTQANSIFNYSGTSSSDNNAKWRLTNWQYAISQISKHPVNGVGFGPAEVPPDVCGTGCNLVVLNDPTVLPGADLHNSLLAVGLRLGLPGLALFLVFEVFVLAAARRRLRSSSIGQWLLACHLLTGFTALTAVVLEGPYMGIFFWFFGGLVIGWARAGEPEDARALSTQPAT